MARPAILSSVPVPQSVHFALRAQMSDFEMSRLAKAFGASDRTIRRVIRQLFDRSPEEWLKEQRLLQSLQWLAEGMSVKEAAFKSGFKQQAHFSREFKKAFEISPTAYIEMRRKTDLVPLT